MRELIRLLSSRLPVGKIPGIWEFILPLLYNSPPLSLSLALYCFHTLCHKIQVQSPINLYTYLALFVLLTTTFLLFSFAAHSQPLHQSHSNTSLYYIPLRLIRLIASSTCNHIIRAFFQSSLLQPSHLLPCLLHAYFLLV